jgi:hypothetical protein
LTKPDFYCHRPFIQIASANSETSQVLKSILQRFDAQTSDEAERSMKLLRKSIKFEGGESIMNFAKLHKPDHGNSFIFFLEQLKKLPRFDHIPEMAKVLGQDCSKWVEAYSNERFSHFNYQIDITEDQYL